jgi:hypothetical protein
VAEGGSPPLAAVGLIAAGYVSACPVQSAGLAVLWLGHGLEFVGCRGARPRGLDDGGVMRRYPLGGVIVEPQLDSVRFNVIASFGFPCSFLFIL